MNELLLKSKKPYLIRILSFLLIYFIAFFSKCIAQTDLPKVLPASPQAMDIAKYVNYPVSYSTGIPEISIPLYEIKVDGLTLPISLSYHASGLKANQLSGWVGFGWTLNAEPAITRSVKGSADELADYRHGYLITDFDMLKSTSTASWFEIMRYWNRCSDGDIDTEPDEFYYKLLGKSGKFYYTRPNLGNTRKIVTFPYTPIFIEPNTDGSFKNSKITDSDGSEYYFNSTSGVGSSTESSAATTSLSYITSWKASKIITPNHHEIKFKYYDYNSVFSQPINRDKVEVEDAASNHHDGYIYEPLHQGQNYDASTFFLENYYTEMPLVKEYYKDGTYYKMVAGGGNAMNGYVSLETDPAPSVGSWYEPSSENDTRKTYVSTSFLNEINFPNGKVVFEKNNDQLKSIQIFNNETLLKKVSFFAQQHYDDGNYLYTLDSIHIYTPSNERIESYSFDYHEGYYRGSADHWGFIKSPSGSTYHGSRIPIQEVTTSRQYYHESDTGTVTFTIGNNNMEPYEEPTKSHVLKKIVYPTGGYTTYEYELNKYKHLGEIKKAGGLRVSKISHYEGGSGTSPLVRTYKYGENEDGAGIAKRPFFAEDYMYEQGHSYYNPRHGCCTYGFQDPVSLRRRTYLSSGLVDPFYSDGAPVIYGKVTEYIGDTNPIGKNEYTYKVDSNAWVKITKYSGTPIVKDPKEDWKWNELIGEKNFKYENGQYVPLKEKQFDYAIRENIDTVFSYYLFKKQIITDFENPDGNWFADVGASGPGVPLEYPGYITSAHSFTTGTKLLSTEKIITHESTGPITETKVYKHNADNQLVYSAIVNSTQDSMITRYKYPQDYGTQLSFLKKNGLWLDKEIEESLYKNTTHLQTTKTNYTTWNNNIIAPQTVEEKQGSYPFEVKLRYYDYTDNGSVESVSQESDSKVCYVWSYNGQYPVAKIENADLNTVISVLGGSAAIDNFRNSNPDNATVISFLASLRTHPNLEGAMVSTYTYKPLVGITSATDPKNQTTYYEYDNLQRLKHIKDADDNIIKSYSYHYKTSNP